MHYQRRLGRPPGDSTRSVVPLSILHWQRDTLLELPPGKHIERPATLGAAPNLSQPGALTALGWLLTAVALSFGAPFWFELLNRFVNMRGIGLKPTTAQAVLTSATEPRRS